MDFTKKIILLGTAVFFSSAFLATPAQAAKLFLSPSSGTFTVGSTFDVNVFLNTEGASVNTVSAVLSFPADKLQLVSPTIGQSVISVWTAQPVFNNQTGTVRLTGGIPNGINVQSGLITSLTFRVKQVGSSTLVKFSDESRVLANDGSGSDVLTSTQNGVYNLILPPPQGPIVSSETHPDQSKWYANNNVILRWASTNAIENYSYVLDKDAAGAPDNISEGNNTTVIYKNLDEGTHYFHIKSSRDGVWGGVTSFGINIDTEPPAEFSLQFNPSSRTSSKNQIINFETSDALSGTTYYEIKIIPLSQNSSISGQDNNLFIETTSPYQTALGIGSYDVIVRAYDKAGNYREVTSRLNVVTPLFEIASTQGIKVGGLFIIPWLWLWILFGFMICVMSFVIWHIEKWHRHLDRHRKSKELPKEIKSQLETLNQYRKKYGDLLLLLLLVGSLMFGGRVQAADVSQASLSVPFISSVSRNISNEEIFYVGGKTDEGNITVIIYLQNLQSGATFNETVTSDAKGNWFYRHGTFLESGEYLLWTQSKLGDQLSPPSPQIQMQVQKTAIQFGASRFSYETMYLMVAVALLLMILILMMLIVWRALHARKKHALVSKEVAEAQESVRRGFAVLKRDIEAQLATVRKTGQSEAHLLRDLEIVQKHISKEIWDIQQTES